VRESSVLSLLVFSLVGISPFLGKSVLSPKLWRAFRNEKREKKGLCWVLEMKMGKLTTFIELDQRTTNSTDGGVGYLTQEVSTWRIQLHPNKGRWPPFSYFPSLFPNSDNGQLGWMEELPTGWPCSDTPAYWILGWEFINVGLEM